MIELFQKAAVTRMGRCGCAPSAKLSFENLGFSSCHIYRFETQQLLFYREAFIICGWLAGFRMCGWPMLSKKWVAGGFNYLWMANALIICGWHAFRRMCGLTRLIGGWGALPGPQGPQSAISTVIPILLKALPPTYYKSIGHPHIIKTASHPFF